MNEKRGTLFYFAIALLCLIIGWRLFSLQVSEHEKYRVLALQNASRTTPIVAPRGIIYDRNGKVLLKNRPVFSVFLSPHGLPDDPSPVLQHLSSIIGMRYEEISRRLEAKKRSSRFGNIKIMTDVPLSIVSLIQEQQEQLPGVEVTCYPLRSYPLGGVGIHVLGYIGEIGDTELETARKLGYRIGDLIGKDGVEKKYDQYLRGVAGGTKVEVDSRGKPVRQIETLEPELGDDVTLTLDMDLQEAAEKALGSYRGAVVVLDPNSGAILAMASHPSHDPGKSWDRINYRYHPFMNRALTAYPPGSTYKVITLAAALEEKLVDLNERFVCRGSYKLGNRTAKCWKETGHGILNAAEGLVWSCDIVFYELGRRLGPDRMAEYSAKFGLGQRTGIDLPSEKKGVVPTRAWKEQVIGEKWFEGESINMGIGQGYTQVTPLQLSGVYGFIATGKRFKPYVVQEVRSKSGEVLYQAASQEVSSWPFSENTLKVIRDCLAAVVSRATGRAANVPGLPASGKTGTAENPGLPHAWFACYAPSDAPQIVVVAFVEHGEHGDQSSAYVAHDILAWYKDNRYKGPEVSSPPQP